MDGHQDWYTVKQVATRLQVNPETVHRWMRSGELGYLDLGKRAYRIRASDLAELVERRFKPARAAPPATSGRDDDGGE